MFAVKGRIIISTIRTFAMSIFMMNGGENMVTDTEPTPGTNAMVFGAMVQLVFAVLFILNSEYLFSLPFIIMVGVIAIMQRYTALSYQSELEAIE